MLIDDPEFVQCEYISDKYDSDYWMNGHYIVEGYINTPELLSKDRVGSMVYGCIKVNDLDRLMVESRRVDNIKIS